MPKEEVKKTHTPQPQKMGELHMDHFTESECKSWQTLPIDQEAEIQARNKIQDKYPLIEIALKRNEVIFNDQRRADISPWQVALYNRDQPGMYYDFAAEPIFFCLHHLYENQSYWEKELKRDYPVFYAMLQKKISGLLDQQSQFPIPLRLIFCYWQRLYNKAHEFIKAECLWGDLDVKDLKDKHWQGLLKSIEKNQILNPVQKVFNSMRIFSIRSPSDSGHEVIKSFSSSAPGLS